MFRSLAANRPRRLLVLAAAALIPVLAGCEAGGNSPTQQWHPPTDGAQAMVAGIAIRNLFVLGPPIGKSLPAGGDASVFLALVNEGSPDVLTGVSAPGTASSVSLPNGGAVNLPRQRGVFFTGPAPEVILHGLTRPLTGGSSVRLVLDFANAGSKSLTVPVMPRAQYYSTLQPPPSPTPTPTPTPSVSPTPAATGTPAPSTGVESGAVAPTPTPTPTPTP